MHGPCRGGEPQHLKSGRGDAKAGLLTQASCLTSSSQAQVWGSLIADAEQPSPLSPREGKLLRLVPLESRLAQADLAWNLQLAIDSRLQHDSQLILLEYHSGGREGKKAACALMRSYAYLQAKRWDQALRDAKVAAVYSAGLSKKRESWPRSLAAISSAIEGSQEDNTQAALHMQRAVEQEPGNAEYLADLERLMSRIPDQHCEALQAGGAKALEGLLAKEAEDALPEFKKARPKYYYYYNWMRDRVSKACGQLPAPVIEKLIRIDATELDMLLTYPKGIQQQAQLLLDVYETRGEENLMQHRIPLLTWQESEDLKAAYKIAAPPEKPKPALLESKPQSWLDSAEDLDSLQPVDFDLVD